MVEYKDLTRETLPCWSKLSWMPAPAIISIWIHDDLIHPLDSLQSDHHVVAPLLTYGPFMNNTHEWGIDGTLKRSLKTDDGFHGFHLEIPLVHLATGTCPHCEGNIEDDLGFECLYCNKTGIQTEFDWKTLHAMSASVSLLTTFVNEFAPEIDTPAPTPQLLSFTTHTQDMLYDLSGTYSEMLVNWFRQIGPCLLEEAVQAMRETHRVLFGTLEDYNDNEFRAQITSDSGWLNIAAPGNACSLNPVQLDIPKEGGYEFSPHNMDSPLQQITLLAGLAALEMQARKELGY